MKKICIVSPDGFPVPAVKGGAVETVINNFLDENERFKKLDIVCLSVYNKEALKESKKYKYTKFIYYKMPKLKLTNFFIRIINYIFRKIFKKNLKYYIHSKRLYLKIKNMDFDYIIVEGGDAISYTYLLKKYEKRKTVLHMHGADVSGKHNKELSEMYGKFIALNNFTKSTILKENIIKASNVYIVPNGIDVERFNKTISDKEKDILRKKYNIKDDEKIILFCGRLIPEKGIMEVIKSLELLDTNQKYKLLIVGNSAFGKNAKTDFEIELFNLAEKFKNNIVFTGFIHNSELYKIHSISDIFVAPSICDEAFGLVFLEAMAAGLPIISTNSGGIPELVGNKAGILLERDKELINNIAKNLKLLLEDENLRKEMGESGKQISKNYTLENVYNIFVNVINEMDGN